MVKRSAAPRSVRAFRRVIDRDAIDAAIRRVRQKTTGDLRVVVSPTFWGSVRHNAERALTLLAPGDRGHENGVLLFIVPRRRSFAIVGDAGIHDRSGQELWHGARDRLSAAFRDGRYTEGIVEAIETIGAELATHFPRERS